MASNKKAAAPKEDGRPALVPKLRFPEFRVGPKWPQHELGSIAVILKGKGIAKADLDPDGSQACIRYGELYTRYGETIREVVSRTKVPASELFLSETDDVIIPSSGETKIDIAKASCVLAADIALGGDLNVIRAELNGTFLSYYLNGPKKLDIAKVAQGDTVVHLYPHQLEALHIAVPSPAEQRAIAECLSSVDEEIAAHSRKVDALKIHKRGLMHQLFPRAGETHPRVRFPEFRQAGDWKATTLNTLLFETKTRNKSLELGPTDVLSVSGEHGCINQIDFMGRSYAGVSVKDYHVVEHGDVVYTKSPLKRNPFGIIKANKGKRGIVSTLYAVYRPFPNCSATYLEHFFSVDYNLNSYLQPIVRKGAKNDMKVNNADVLKGNIRVPELPEQQTIAECLSGLDALIIAEVKRLQYLRRHKRGLMQQLFPSSDEAEA